MNDKTLLDLQGNSFKALSKEQAEECTRIMETPDILARLYRLFVFQNIRTGYWKELFERYILENEENGPTWVNNRKTNMERNLFRYDTLTWPAFLEGMVVLLPAFDTLEISVFTDLNSGISTKLKITPNTVLIDKGANIEPLPKGELLVPPDYYRTPLEPLPMRIVRDLIVPLRTADNFRNEVRKNLKGIVPDSKINSTVNSMYLSLTKPEMSWKRMIAIVFAIGANTIMIKVRGMKNGKSYYTIMDIKR